jgi:hypothetical protein
MIEKNDIKFLISVPLSINYVILAVNQFILQPKTYSHFIHNTKDRDRVYGTIVDLIFIDHEIVIKDDINELKSNNYTPLFGYVYYNAESNKKKKVQLFEELKIAKDYVLKNGKLSKYATIINKYCQIKYSNDNKRIIDIVINDDLLEDKLKNNGYFMLLSNTKLSIDEAYNLYRKRNVVEEAYNSYKNHLGLDRFHIQGNKRMVNKSFLCFIALIIYSYIYKKMLDNSLFKSTMTLDRLLTQFNKIKSFKINGEEHIRPLTSEQKKLLSAFDIELPVKIYT